jgi:hypothetical protein
MTDRDRAIADAVKAHPSSVGRQRHYRCSVCKDPDAPTRSVKLAVIPSTSPPFGFGEYGWACEACAADLEEAE